MNDSHPENEPRDESHDPHQEPIHAEFQHQSHTARVPEQVLPGVFANAAIVLSGQYEFVIDFLIRMGKPERVLARIILPPPVVGQFLRALQESLKNFEQQFGAVPTIPKPINVPSVPPSAGIASEASAAPVAQGQSKPGKVPTIDEIYEEIKLDDASLGGVYANAVLIRHSLTEFCFDFVTNIYPRSVVNARVYMAVPQVPAIWQSLSHSYEQFQKRRSSQHPEEG